MVIHQFHILYCILLFNILAPIGAAPPKIFRKYKLVHEAVEVTGSRPECRYNLWIRKFNRTTPVLNYDMEILDPKINDLQVWIEGFERLGLEHIYRKSAISLCSNYCDFVTGSKFLLNRGFRDYGNMPTSCPVKVGNYSFRNWVFEDKYLPPIVPGMYWRLDFYLGPPGINIHSNETSKISYYCKVVYV